jgi:hypothetical protein
VRLIARGTDTGTVREAITVKGRRRALVSWKSDGCDQFVDVAKLERAGAVVAKVTADTITAAQIHALRASFPLAMHDEFAVEYACGERPSNARQLRDARARCAEILNARGVS